MAAMQNNVSMFSPTNRRMMLAMLLGEAPLRAADVAQMLGVTVRTLYRDIEDLRAAGFAIEGQHGVGYLMPAAPAAGPLAFSRDELRALIAGAKLVKAGGDAVLAGAAGSLLRKAQRL